MAHDERRSLDLINDVGHRDSLARTRNAPKSSMAIPRLNRLNQLGDSLLLIPLGAKFTDELKIHVENLG